MGTNEYKMIHKFNLYNLHKDIDIHPRSWICVKGGGIKEIINKIENRIIKERKLCRKHISKILSKKLNCSFGSFKRILQGNTEYFPLPFIKELINLCNDQSYLSKIHSKIQYLKVNSASSKEILAIKKLNGDLSKIIGAFMADGSLTVTIIFASMNKTSLKSIKSTLNKNKISYKEWYCKSRKEHDVSTTVDQINYKKIDKIIYNVNKKIHLQLHHNLEISDGYKDNLEAFKRWVLNCFNLFPTSFEKKKEAWRLIYSNKIIARYLIAFFDIIPGPKSYTAFEPQIIRNSYFEIRKLFAKGVLMFDGCFSSGKILFSTKSNILFKSINNILVGDGIETGSTINRGSYCLFTYENNAKGKFLYYFTKGTCK